MVAPAWPEPLTTVRNLRAYDPATNTLNILWDRAEGNPRQYKLFYAPPAGSLEELVIFSCREKCMFQLGERTGQKCPSVQSDAKQHGCSLGICPGPVQQYRVLCSHLAGMRPSEPVTLDVVVESLPKGPKWEVVEVAKRQVTMKWTEESESLGRQPTASPHPGITLMGQFSSTGSLFLPPLVTQSVNMPQALGSGPALSRATGPHLSQPSHPHCCVVAPALLTVEDPVVHTLILLSHPGPDVHGILQGATVLTACWRIFAFLVFIWRTVLAEKPQKYQVTIKHITEKINNLKNENRELAENISTWEQKTNDSKKCLEETIRQKKMLSDEALKFKENIKTMERVNEYLNYFIQIVQVKLQSARDQNAKRQCSVKSLAATLTMIGTNQDLLEEIDRLAMNEDQLKKEMQDTKGQNELFGVPLLEPEVRDPVCCKLSTGSDTAFDPKPKFMEQREGKVEDHRAASGSVKLGEEAKFQRLEQRIRFLKEIAGQLNRKLDMKRCELVEKKQLLAVEEKLKLGEEETQKYKRRLEECQRQMQEAEIAWRHQIALAEKKAQDNWLRAQALERENAEMRREVAYLKQRLEAISRQRQAEEYMRQEAILGGPYGLHPPLTCKEHTVKCSSFISAAKAAQWAPCPLG
ncbi:Transport and Golgi organization protein 1-like protein [Camelus dromedarius]|uniref:Transport and Golgi organization protein 1-like protein n=1 Tax=Camelus dromedarius TaxID=9838 RepID=A0A5N4DFJ4_CAMDR|nr:Transport and Golgi organization protein 1-like protein [Camelus dromedarius]